MAGHSLHLLSGRNRCCIVSQYRARAAVFIHRLCRDISVTGDSSVTAATCYVRQLNLAQYGLEGTIPDSLASLQYLQALQLSSNRISGTISPFLWNLNHLESFVVGENVFIGSIPTFLDVAVKNLTYLALANNELQGTFPASLCNLHKLAMLTLGASSSITGTLPSCIGSLGQLDTF